MDNVHKLPLPEDPVEDASLWLSRIDRGLTESEREALQSWLASDPARADALMEVARVWDRMDVLSFLADLFPEPQQQQRRISRSNWARAASVLLVPLAAYWVVHMFILPAPEGPARADSVYFEQSFRTTIGERAEMNFPDGSHVALNTNSQIRIQFTGARRRLFLQQGEAYIQVAPDQSRPFSVLAGDKLFEAVGTAFNVKITQDRQVELIVTEGRVLVGVAVEQSPAVSGRQRPARPAEMPALAAGMGSPRAYSPIPVAAGERMLLGESEEQVMQLDPEKIRVELSWREGNIIFRGVSLEDALNEIERYTPVEFVIQDEGLKKTRIVGLFKAGDVEGLLAMLRANFDIAHERVNGEVILTKK